MSVHALNTALVGFEVFATNTPPMPWLYALPTFLCLAAYIVGVGAAGLIIFALVRTVMWARARAVRALVARGTLRERLAPVHQEEPAARESKKGSEERV
jgi:hypothetical protein